jgi:hypothetical protein
MGLGSGQVKCISSVVESKFRNTILDMTPMFPCNTCTQFHGVLYSSKVVNPDNIPFQTNAWNMHDNRQCYRMKSAYLSNIRWWRHYTRYSEGSIPREGTDIPWYLRRLPDRMVLQLLSTCAYRGPKPPSGSAVWWHCSNCVKYYKKCCRRANTAGCFTALVIYIFEISYFSFDKKSCTTLKEKKLIILGEMLK